MRQTKLAAVLSVLGVLALVVAACAPAATPTPTSTPTPPPVVATPTPTPGVATPTPTPPPFGVTPPPEAVLTLEALEAKVLIPTPAQYGGVLWHYYTAMTTVWDPQRAMTGGVHAFTAPIFNSLVIYHPLSDLYLPQYIQPELAERWEISPDGLVWTFYLRKGVKWHDGQPFTAKDVKYSLEKLADPKKSYYAVEYAVLDRVEVVDDYTAKVYLKSPSGLFLSMLASGLSGTMMAEHLKEVSYRLPAFAIGTGPFKFKSLTPGVDVVYEKNPDYWRPGRPYLDGYMNPILSEAAAQLAFQAGRLDIGPSGSYEYMETYRRYAPEVVIAVIETYPVLRFMFVNFAKEGPWQDVRVRKALAMVLDYPGNVLAALGHESLGSYKGGYFISAPLGIGLPWSEYEKAWGLDQPLEVRIAEAKRLMAAAGYPNGFKAEVLNSGSGRGYEGPILLAQDLWRRYLNIDLAYFTAERTIALDRVYRGDFDFAFGGLPAVAGDPEQFLASTYIPGGGNNYGKYSHPLIIELYEQLQRETKHERRVELIHQIERQLIADIASLPGYKAYTFLAYRPYLKNIVPQSPFWTWRYSKAEIYWFDKSDPTWAKRTVGR